MTMHPQYPAQQYPAQSPAPAPAPVGGDQFYDPEEPKGGQTSQFPFRDHDGQIVIVQVHGYSPHHTSQYSPEGAPPAPAVFAHILNPYEAEPYHAQPTGGPEDEVTPEQYRRSGRRGRFYPNVTIMTKAVVERIKPALDAQGPGALVIVQAAKVKTASGHYAGTCKKVEAPLREQVRQWYLAEVAAAGDPFLSVPRFESSVSAEFVAPVAPPVDQQAAALGFQVPPAPSAAPVATQQALPPAAPPPGAAYVPQYPPSPAQQPTAAPVAPALAQDPFAPQVPAQPAAQAVPVTAPGPVQSTPDLSQFPDTPLAGRQVPPAPAPAPSGETQSPPF